MSGALLKTDSKLRQARGTMDHMLSGSTIVLYIAAFKLLFRCSATWIRVNDWAIQSKTSFARWNRAIAPSNNKAFITSRIPAAAKTRLVAPHVETILKNQSLHSA